MVISTYWPDSRWPLSDDDCEDEQAPGPQRVRSETPTVPVESLYPAGEGREGQLPPSSGTAVATERFWVF